MGFNGWDSAVYNGLNAVIHRHVDGIKNESLEGNLYLNWINQNPVFFGKDMYYIDPKTGLYNGISKTAQVSQYLNGVLVGQSTGTPKNVWYRVFTLSKPNSSYENFYITFLVQRTYAGSTQAGILRIDIRMSSTAGLVEAASTKLVWIAGISGMSSITDKFALNYTTSGQNIALFVKIDIGWAGYDFTVLSAGTRTSRNDLQMTLHNTGFTDGGESDELPYSNTIYSTMQ